MRGVPLSRPVSLRRRMAPLSDRRILAPLGTTLMMVAGFNIVYIFSSTVTAAATHGSGALLAVLLFSYGVAGVVGNLAAGPASDRFGSRPTAVLMLAGQVAVLAVLTIVEASFAASVIVFATWGFVTFATVIPLQHCLVHVDPESAAVTLSWYSTAMYVGIAVAPPLATAAIAIGRARGLPVAGSLATLAAMVLPHGRLRGRQGCRHVTQPVILLVDRHMTLHSAAIAIMIGPRIRNNPRGSKVHQRRTTWRPSGPIGTTTGRS